MRKSKLSPELRSELKKYIRQLERLHEQEQRVRDQMTLEGVFDDSERLVEAADRLPSCYLKFSLFERFHELSPRVPLSQAPEK